MDYITLQPRLKACSFAILFLMAGCGGGGRLQISAPSPNTANLTSLTTTPPIEPELAVDHLLNAPHANAQAVVIEQELSQLGPSFPWSRFWDLLAQRTATNKNLLLPPNRAALFDLHKLSCTEASFRSFVHLATHYSEASPWIAGPRRQCQTSLGPSETRRTLETLFQHFTNDAANSLQTAQSISSLLSQEMRQNINVVNTDNRDGWVNAANALSETSWRRILDALGHDEQSSGAFIALLRSHIELNVYPALANSLFEHLVGRDEPFFAMANRELSLQRILTILRGINDNRFESLNRTQAQRLLNRMEAAFNPMALPEQGADRWSRALSLVLEMRSLARKLGPSNFDKNTLSWMERIHRKMETLLRTSGGSLQTFLESNRGSLDVAWLEWRLLPKDTARPLTIDRAVLNRNDTDPSDQVLKARLAIHLSENATQTHERINQFCDLLTTLHIEPQRLAANDLQEFLQRTQTSSEPGCFTFKAPPGNLERANQHFDIHVNDHSLFVNMPFDSVVRLPGIDTTIDVAFLDGGIIDLSSDKIFEPLPAEPTPDDADAITFAVPLGFRVEHGAHFLPGVHWVLLHLPFKLAEKGPLAQAVPENGLNGGQFNLTIQNATHNGVPSQPPTVTSLGSEGQAGAPRRRGGRIDQSVVSLDPRAWLHWRFLERNTHPEDLRNNVEYHTFFRPLLQDLRDLVLDSSWNRESMQVDITDTYIFELMQDYPEQIRKITRKVCPGDQLSRLNCFKSTVKHRALEVFLAELTKTDQRSPLLSHRGTVSTYPELPEENASQQFGPLGDVNPNGLSGQNGAINFHGFHELGDF